MALSGYTISKIPFYFVPELITPNIYTNTISALAQKPNWYILHYDKFHSSEAKRRAAYRYAYDHKWIPTRRAPEDMSWDEFPYASTMEGGKGSYVWAVPERENWLQGGYLGAFIRWTLKSTDNAPFLVLPIAQQYD